MSTDLIWVSSLQILDLDPEGNGTSEDAQKKEAKPEEKKENGDKKEGEEESKAEVSEEQKELQKKAKEYLEAKGDGEEAAAQGKKRKRKRTKEFDDDSSGSSEEEEDEEELPPGAEKKEENEKKEGEDAEMKEQDKKEEDEKKEEDAAAVEKKEQQDDEMEEGEEGPKPRPLHKTVSIFLRNLAPTITKAEVEAMCKRYPGFLRVTLADPQPERRWFRRGWVSFERNVKIKDICYTLNNIRLRDCELGPIVNRDLQRRVRTVSGITVDKKVVRNDIKLAAKVITNLDKRWGLWEKEKNKKEETPADGENGSEEKKAAATEEEEKKPADNNGGIMSLDEMMIGMKSANPMLENITDYLIEEASAEEEELLGRSNDLEDGEEGEEGNKIVRDEELIRVLDRLLLYLRIVHSVDFYNHSEYPNEDEMPNRCGVIHARSAAPVSNVTQQEIDDYMATFEKKMGSFLQPREDLKDDDAKKLGMKDEKEEVEKFIQANTQELGKDKWLCPLSGKKFKGPDFVRKHIFNKHGEKVEEVKKEVQYYNAYLKDPKRPSVPEAVQRGGGGGGQSSKADSGFAVAEQQQQFQQQQHRTNKPLPSFQK